MPVIDASVVVAYLSGMAGAEQAKAVLFDDERARWVPQLMDPEVGHALRRIVAAGELHPAAGGLALRELTDLPLVRANHAPLLQRAWELRENVSFYDAIYVALAEHVGELITFDRRLARAAEGVVDVQLLSAS